MCKEQDHECCEVLKELMEICKGVETVHGAIVITNEIPKDLYLKASSLASSDKSSIVSKK